MKVLIVGLDGATFDLLRPWVDEGKLPTLSMVMQGGIWGEMKSTIPPVSIPAWISLATGVNPGKIGVFDFLSRKDHRYKLYPSTSAGFRGRSMWDYVAAEKGKKVGLVNYVMLYPLHEINGFMVSRTIDSRTDDITFPRALRDKLDEICDGYEDVLDYESMQYDDTDLFLRDVNRVLDKQFAAIGYLIEQPWDLLIYVISATDWVQHLMWKYLDTSHSLYDREESVKYTARLLEFWQRIDDFLGQITMMNTASNLLIVSDHGFGPQDKCFNLTKWLEMKGYLVRTRNTKNLKTHILRVLVKTGIGRIIPRQFARKVESKLVVDIANQIDFSRSKAYVLGHTVPFGAIYINAEGKGTQPCIKAWEYEIVKAQIVNDLKNLRKDIGRDVNVEVFDTAEVYRGPYVNRGPDIIFTIDNWRCIVSEERFYGALFKDEPNSSRHTGSHRMNGIFIAYGPDFKDTGEELAGLNIYDIAPTILHMFGVPIPDDVDGRVLREVFREDSECSSRRIEYAIIDERKRIKRKVSEIRRLKRI